jgi:hypothetical protein
MSKRKIHKVIILVVLLTALLSAACQPGTPPAPANQPQPQPQMNEPPAAAQNETSELPAPSGDPLVNCPKEEPGKILLVSEVNGFCFLYPSAFSAQRDEMRPNQVVKLTGPLEEEKQKSMNRVAPVMWVASNGPADVADSAAYAQKYRDLKGQFEPLDLPGRPVVIAGYPAELVSEQPGMLPQQMAFVVANGTKYTLTLHPELGLNAELDPALREVWETVTGSIVFFAPLVTSPVVLPGEACPTPAAGEALYIHELDGYCFLYPQEFAPEAGFPGRLLGDLNLGSWQGFENVHPSLGLGSYPLMQGEAAQTPRALMESRSDVAPDSVREQTIGGALGVVFMVRPPAGPWASQQAIVVKDGRVYTLLSDPWEPERWPQAIPLVQTAWDTVLRSLTFFNPWN